MSKANRLWCLRTGPFAASTSLPIWSMQGSGSAAQSLSAPDFCWELCCKAGVCSAPPILQPCGCSKQRARRGQPHPAPQHPTSMGLKLHKCKTQRRRAAWGNAPGSLLLLGKQRILLQHRNPSESRAGPRPCPQVLPPHRTQQQPPSSPHHCVCTAFLWASG